MTDEISYFEVASYLAEIESVEISDPIDRAQWLVTRLREKCSGLSRRGLA